MKTSSIGLSVRSRTLRLFCLAFAVSGMAAAARADLTLTGVSMVGATDASGAWNGSYDFWDTLGDDQAYNVYLFTGPISAPNFLNSGNSDDSLNPRLKLAPGTNTFEFAIDVLAADPSTPYLGINLFFNNNSDTNQISAVVPNSGSCNFSVVNQSVSTYGEGSEAAGSGALSYTAGGMTATLTGFCVSSTTPNIVSGYDNSPGDDTDFTGHFTLTVTAAQPAAAEQPAVTTWPATVLAWASNPNTTYQAQWSTNEGNDWFNLGAPVQGNGTTNYLFDAPDSGRTYRVTVAQ
jgi:hypothetical protein